MDATSIVQDNLTYFETLLLPDVLTRLRAGKAVFALGLVEEGVACGALAGGVMESTFYIDSLFVAPSYRRRGGARLLLDTLYHCMEGAHQLWEVHAAFSMWAEEHMTLLPFLQAAGFTTEAEVAGCYALRLSELRDNPYFAARGKRAGLYSFSALPSAVVSALAQRLLTQDETLTAQALKRDEFEAGVSTALVTGGKVDAFLLFDHSCADLLTLSYADIGERNDPAVFSALLRHAFQCAIAQYPPETLVALQTVTPLSRALLQRIMPQATPISYTATLRFREREEG